MLLEPRENVIIFLQLKLIIIIRIKTIIIIINIIIIMIMMMLMLMMMMMMIIIIIVIISSCSGGGGGGGSSSSSITIIIIFIIVLVTVFLLFFFLFIWQINARQDYLPREKLEKYLTINPSSSLSSLVPRGMSEDELTAKLTLKLKTVSASIIFFYSNTMAIATTTKKSQICASSRWSIDFCMPCIPHKCMFHFDLIRPLWPSDVD